MVSLGDGGADKTEIGDDGAPLLVEEEVIGLKGGREGEREGGRVIRRYQRKKGRGGEGREGGREGGRYLEIAVHDPSSMEVVHALRHV